MYLDWTSKPLSRLCHEERERVANFMQRYPAEYTFCLIERLSHDDDWNRMRDFAAVFSSQLETLWSRFPVHLRDELHTYIDQHQAEPTSNILGLKFGLSVLEKSEQLIKHNSETQATAKLGAQLYLTTDEALAHAIEGASCDDITVLLKILPVARTGLISSRVSEQLLANAIALLDSPCANIDSSVDTWIERLNKADEMIGKSRRDYKRIAQCMLGSDD